MYWIYLAIFVAVVFTPLYIQNDQMFLGEEEFEALVIFSLGVLGFVLYLAKENALLRMIKEKLLLQKQTNIITRDLSDSYSYIGEMNRKFDIVKNLAFHLPEAVSQAPETGSKDFYAALLEAVGMLAKTGSISLRFVNTKERRIEEKIEEGGVPEFEPFTAKKLLGEKKLFWEEGECIVARSPREACGVHAYLVFLKKVNAVEDAEIFKILASEALFLYCGRRIFFPPKEVK